MSDFFLSVRLTAGGELHYTHRPLPGWRVVGTVYVRSPELNRWGFTEIRFVETIKVKSK